MSFHRIVTFLICCYVTSLSAEARVQSVDRWVVRSWQTRDGLPENGVQAIAQTEDGFLWIGTSGGLARFDGESFESVNERHAAELNEGGIPCLLVSKDHSLWICTDGAGAVRWVDGRFEHYGAAEGITELFTRAMFEDRNGTLWIGTSNGLFRKMLTGAFEKVSGSEGFSISAIGEDEEGNLLIGGAALYVYKGGVFQEIYRGTAGDANIRTILRAPDGSLWVGSTSGLSIRRSNDAAFAQVPQIHGPVSSLHLSLKNGVIVGTSGDGVYLYREGRFDHIEPSSATERSAVLSSFQSHDGSIWTGTQAGLTQMAESSVEIVHLPGPSNLDFGTVYLDNEETLWVASRRLFRVVHGVAKPYLLPELQGAYVLNVIRDQKKDLWLGTNGSGIFRVTPLGVKHYTTADGLANNFIRIMTEARDGSIWIGTNAGVSHFKNGNFQNLSVKEGLCNPVVQAIVEGRNKDVWIGTARGISHLVENNFVENVITRGLRNEKVWSIFAMGDGTLWIGTRSGGLYRYDLHNLLHFTSADGLGTDSIYKLVADKSSHLWISGPKGILSVRTRELTDHAANPKNEIVPQSYLIFDRGEPVQLFGGIQSGGVAGRSGDVWFPSDHGPVHIEPISESGGLPKLRIKAVVADGERILSKDALHLSANSNKLEIQYAPILAPPQSAMRYRYKIEGLDPDWLPLFQRKTVYLTNLPAGKYRFRVQGYLATHPGEYAEASLLIEKAQRFYRTWWFSTALLIVLLLIALILHSLKVRRVKKAFQLVLDERVRLAREMHDTLLQGCASVSTLLEASSSSEIDRETSRAFMEYAKTQISATMDDARRAVWNLRGGEISNVSLGSELCQMAQRLGAEYMHHVSCDIDPRVPSTDPKTTHELLMVFQEALYNALVHSRSTSIDVKVHIVGAEVVFSVTDDGIGFNAVTAPLMGHYGLAGMRERIHRLEGTFDVRSAQGEGTVVSFRVGLGKLSGDFVHHG